MKWSEAVARVKEIIEDVDAQTDHVYGEVQEAIDKLRLMLNAIDGDNDTEIPA